jgi:hypothetical protein
MRSRTMLAAGVLGISTMFVVVPAAGASTIQGTGDTIGIQSCAGQGNPAELTIRDQQGRLHAREWHVAGTCNGDGTYRGHVADTFEDGRCALVKFMDAGITSTQGIDCTADDGPVQYVFNDRNGDHRAQIKLCLEGLCPEAPWWPIQGY